MKFIGVNCSLPCLWPKFSKFQVCLCPPFDYAQDDTAGMTVRWHYGFLICSWSIFRFRGGNCGKVEGVCLEFKRSVAVRGLSLFKRLDFKQGYRNGMQHHWSPKPWGYDAILKNRWLWTPNMWKSGRVENCSPFCLEFKRSVAIRGYLV